MSDPDPHLLGWERRRGGGRVKCSLLQFYVSWYGILVEIWSLYAGLTQIFYLVVFVILIHHRMVGKVLIVFLVRDQRVQDLLYVYLVVFVIHVGVEVEMMRLNVLAFLLERPLYTIE